MGIEYQAAYLCLLFVIVLACSCNGIHMGEEKNMNLPDLCYHIIIDEQDLETLE
jgi:hypothetical protein